MTESRRTSFFALTGDDQPDDGLAVESIEIPVFQRDYAQGRENDPVRRIRTDFLDVLLNAVAGDEPAPVGLDFVYGGVDEGTLRPLDGQQRLTTLFLLHWYIASRSGHLDADHGWKRFSYATRQSARMFCETLVTQALPDEERPSEWITDQPWYLFLWRHDPTIQSMLVVLDAIDERFRAADAHAAWTRLTDPDQPAIWFQLLPLSGLGSAPGEDMRPEELYIKMNSRGKPLTEFENFKAHFEKTIQWSPRATELSLKVDTAWSDLLWNLRGDDDLIDDEFLRYMEFVTEICEWREGRTDGAGQRLGARTRTVFGADNPRRDDHLELVFQAFDVWDGRSISETLMALFTSPGQDLEDSSKVRLFFRSDNGDEAPPNLFEACCRSYGETRRRARTFSLGQTLVLYAVLIHLIDGTDDFPRRLRALRNLTEASEDELRPSRMPKILEDVHRLIRDGAIEAVGTLNQAQVEDEKLKAAFIAQNPEHSEVVFALEDHEPLRGSLGAFELDATSFESRATVFRLLMSQPDLWSDLLGALLAVGEYQRQRANSRPFLFGTDSKRHDRAWRELLTGATRDRLRPTRATFGAFLDRVAADSAATSATLADVLKAISTEYLEDCETEQRFDWRYYMVKYPAMREKGSSTYYAEPTNQGEPLAMGYSLCMLQAGGRALNGYYRDPYLLAIAVELDDESVVEDKWFTGYETEPRWLPLTRSGAALRCVPSGFELRPPPMDEHGESFAECRADLGASADCRVAVPQSEDVDPPVDKVDRIQFGADIIRRLVAVGL